MPTYEYACENCGHELERFQSITARPLKKCPECGERSLQRLIGVGGGVIFKGSGFYQTDYRSEAYKKAAEAEKSARSTKTDAAESKAAGGKKGKRSKDSASAKTTKSAGETSSSRKVG
ncbi:MAG: FmdB family zinc ribbon protein [Phycisphaerae bacterium]